MSKDGRKMWTMHVTLKKTGVNGNQLREVVQFWFKLSPIGFKPHIWSTITLQWTTGTGAKATATGR